jgi:uroporphyrin-III C-methyltransferase
MSGRVYFIGAGPGDPELLTVKAMRVLRSADVVLHDGLVTDEILQLARPHAVLRDVGKRVGQQSVTQNAINRLLIESTAWANIVVRLKSGDPSIFGRAGEEFGALRGAQIEFEIVPGITAAVAAAAQARIPLTDRSSASSVFFVTAHKADGSYSIDLQAFTGGQRTIAIYMPGGGYQSLASQMLAAGLAPETPCLIVSNASRPTQQMLWTEIGRLAEVSPLEAPTLLIVGSVASSPSETHVASELLRSVSEISAVRP